MPNSSSRVIESFTARQRVEADFIQWTVRIQRLVEPELRHDVPLQDALRQRAPHLLHFASARGWPVGVIDVSGGERRQRPLAWPPHQAPAAGLARPVSDFNGSQTIGTYSAGRRGGRRVTSAGALRPARALVPFGKNAGNELVDRRPADELRDGTGIPNFRSRLFDRLTDINESSPISLSGRSGSISSTKPSSSLICCCSRLDSCSRGLPIRLRGTRPARTRPARVSAARQPCSRVRQEAGHSNLAGEGRPVRIHDRDLVHVAMHHLIEHPHPAIGRNEFHPHEDNIASPRAPEIVANPPSDQAHQLIAIAGKPAARRCIASESRNALLAV